MLMQMRFRYQEDCRIAEIIGEYSIIHDHQQTKVTVTGSSSQWNITVPKKILWSSLKELFEVQRFFQL